MTTTERAANHGMQYPSTFHEFMGLLDRWHRARGYDAKPAESVGDMLLRTSHELDDVVGMAKEVWQNAESGRASRAQEAPAPVLPQGWKVVPIEPDDAMQLAGAQAVRLPTTPLNKIWTGNAVFRAMLAASPPPPAAPEQQEKPT